MKSLKSVLALFAIVSLSFGCASVTDASLTDQPEDQTQIESTTDDGVFGTGNDMDPIIEKPM
ncbi:MAG: hypothetical protein RI564_07205 [Gracilimonas sp.]|nr:hypothetical protein [Gracilimonas sp.]